MHIRQKPAMHLKYKLFSQKDTSSKTASIIMGSSGGACFKGRFVKYISSAAPEILADSTQLKAPLIPSMSLTSARVLMYVVPLVAEHAAALMLHM